MKYAVLFVVVFAAYCGWIAESCPDSLAAAQCRCMDAHCM